MFFSDRLKLEVIFAAQISVSVASLSAAVSYFNTVSSLALLLRERVCVCVGVCVRVCVPNTTSSANIAQK